MSELTPEQIAQRRRQRILARTRNLNIQTQSNQQNQSKPNQQQSRPLLNPVTSPRAQPLMTPKSQQRKQQADAFTRYKQMQSKAQRQKYLIIISKLLGFIITIVQLYLLTVIKKYQIKYNNKEIPLEVFERVKQKFIDQLDLIFWAVFCTIIFIWVWIKFVKSSRQSTQQIKIVPGSTIFTLLQQVNKVLEYKVLIKALLGYTFTCIIAHLIFNQAISFFGYQNQFYKPNLALILNPIIQNGQNQQIF